MPIESKEEFVVRLEKLDEETLLFLSKYAEERQRTSGLITTVTGVIGSIAGAALAVSYALPKLTIESIAIISALIGAVTAIFAIVGRRRSDAKLIQDILRHAERASKANDLESKRALIERFLKAEGL